MLAVLLVLLSVVNADMKAAIATYEKVSFFFPFLILFFLPFVVAKYALSPAGSLDRQRQLYGVASCRHGKRRGRQGGHQNLLYVLLRQL